MVDVMTTDLAEGHDKVEALAALLAPHSGDLAALWEAVPAAFLDVMGRAADQAEPYDVALCHAAVARVFPVK